MRNKKSNTRKRILAGVFALVILCMPFFSEAKDESVNADINNRSEITEQTMALLSECSEYEGYALSMFQGNDIFFETKSGYAKFETDTLIQEDTVFEWGGTSQLLIWTSVMQLYEQGKLDLDADILTYLPANTFTNIKSINPVTMLHLMNQNAGFQTNLFESYLPEGVPYSDLESTLINTQPVQIFEPGNVVAYSEWGSALAAYIVECISGMSFADYVKENIFLPLSMEHTAILPDLTDNEWVAVNRKQIVGYQGENPIADNFYNVPLYPVGMATGTAKDFTKFAMALTNNEPKLFEKAETLAMFQSASLMFSETQDARMNHGFYTFYFEKPVIGSIGNSVTMSCFLMIEPESKTGITMMSNQYLESKLTEKLPLVLFGSKEEKEQSELDSVRFYEGTYLAANTVYKGKLSFYNLKSIAVFKALNDHSLGFAWAANRPIFVQYNNEYANMRGNTIAHFTSDAGGEKRIETQYFDYLPFSSLQMIIEWAMLFLLIVGYFYSSILLIVAFFRWIYRKLTKQKREKVSFRMFHYIQCLNFTIYSLAFGLMALEAFSYASRKMIDSFSIAYWLCSVMSVIYLLFYVRTGRKVRVDKGEKAAYLITAFGSFVMIGFSLVFHLIF